MNDILWLFSIVLALVFLITGAIEVFRYDIARDRLRWAADLPRALVTLHGIAEILGALGLVLPALTGTYAWLTPYAAIGLALLMLMTATFHMLRRENEDASGYVLLLVMTAFVAYGRLILVPLS